MKKNLNMHINYRGFWSMLALMFGFTIFSASVMTGGQIADGAKISTGIIAIIIGNLFLALYGGANAYIANKKHKNLDGVLKMAFGKNGGVIPSMVMVITQIGWFAVGIGMIVIPIAKAIGINPYLIVFPVTLLITSTAFFGIKSLARLSIIAVPLVIILGFTIIGIASNSSAISEATTIKISLWTGISLVIATFISGATFVPNFAVTANSPKTAVITTFLAFLVGNGLMITFGFIGALFYDDVVFDFVSIASKQGFMALGLIILVLNIWTTNDSGLYSISLGFENWFKIPKKIGVLVFGLVGGGFSILAFDNFITFLSFLNTFVPAVGALIITTYFFANMKVKMLNKYGINFGAIIIWAIASGLTFLPMFKDFAPLVAFGFAFGTSALLFPTLNLIAKVNVVGNKVK